MSHPQHPSNPATGSEAGPERPSDQYDGLTHGSFNEQDLVELDELLVRFGNHEIELWCVEALDGYLTAAKLAPTPLLPSTFLPPIWAKDHVWPDAQSAQRAMELVLRWYQDVVAWPDVPVRDLDIGEGPFVYPLPDNRFRERTHADGTVVREEINQEVGRSWAEGFRAGLVLAGESWQEAMLADDEIAILVGSIHTLDSGSADTGELLGNREAMAFVEDELPGIVREVRRRIRRHAAGSPPDPLSDEIKRVDVPQIDPQILDRVDELLSRYADPQRGIGNLEMLDGFVSALGVMPEPIDVDLHASRIWGRVPEWDSESDEADAPALIESFALWVYSRIAIPPEFARQRERLLPELLAPEGDDDLDAHPDFPLARDWAHGFGKGMAVYSDDWDDLFEFDPETNSLVSPMMVLDLGCNPEKPELVVDIKLRQQLVAALPGFLFELANHWDAFADHHEVDERAAHTPIRRAAPKVGRNHPCPCGSGRKYKLCCGAPARR